MGRRRADTPEPPPWTGLVDVLLQRAALVARVARDRAPDPLVGLKVDDDDLFVLLGELPGLEGRAPVDTADIEARTDAAVRAARRDFAALLASDVAFSRLVRTAALSPDEAEVLATLCAVEADPRRQRLVGYLNDDVTQRRLTLWTLQQIWAPEPGPLLAVAPGAGLRRAGLILPATDGPWATTALAVAPAVLWWLRGAPHHEPDLPPGTEVIAGAPGADHPPESLVAVASSADRRRRLDALARRLGHPTMVIAVPPDEARAWDALVRHATLLGAALVLEVEGELRHDARDRIERADHLAWGIASTAELPLSSLPRRPWTAAPTDPPLATRDEWRQVLGDDVDVAYRLTAEQLHHVGAATRAHDGDLAAAMRRLAAGHIDATAQRIRPVRGWADLVLDDERLSQVKEIAVRCRHRDTVFEEWGFAKEPSVGVVALFAGPSGTGKTLAAEVIAADLGVDLYKVDLANMVSKYIGETEKNLAQVFDAAEASNVALFFDEADALLGKRSAVSDAHDRYANIEVAYLLQRLERYQGVAVLATNLVNNIDPAFVRRFHVVVEFPMPGPQERRRIWARCFPPGAPLRDVDLDSLADDLELTGGTIRNAALGAAFLAADEGGAITMPVVVRAIQRELLKIGRLVTADDFERLTTTRAAPGPPR